MVEVLNLVVIQQIPHIDFHSYDSLNGDYDARILCNGLYGNGNIGGGSINIRALNSFWNSNALATQ